MRSEGKPDKKIIKEIDILKRQIRELHGLKSELEKSKQGLKRYEEKTDDLNTGFRELSNLLQEKDQRLLDNKDKLSEVNKELLESRDELEATLNQLEAQRQLLLFEKNRLQTVIQHMGEGVLVIDSEKNIESMNERAKEILGFEGERDMPIGYKMSFILKLWKELHESRKDIVKKELHIHTPREAVLMITLACLPKKECSEGFVVVIRDITFEKRVEKMKSDFVANVSHEIRSPMAPMKETLSLVLDGTAGPITEKQKEVLTILNDNLERLLRLVNDLLDLSRIEAGKIELRRERVDMASLVKCTVESINVYANRKKIDMSIEAGQGLPKVSCDKDRITQVIINLVMNAVKFTPEGGKVSVQCTMDEGRGMEDEGRGMRDEGRGMKDEGRGMRDERSSKDRTSFIRINVADTGPGMTKEDTEALFERFKRLTGPATVKGTGLGLSIAKAIIEIHKGKIWVESEPGKGSVFCFTLPVK
ncbi:PAS domain-containing protein [Patescibacteria group bacterium]|nr:PAS domain-containing protein [Patescibacteria group bacterium]